MKYSFIIPMYNEENDIEKTVMHCLAQKIGEFQFEIILVNDGSTDNTLKVCSDLFSSDEHIHIINEPINRGVSHARNVGVSASTGNVVIFLNSDELIRSDFLMRLHQYYNSKGTDYIFPQTRVENTDSAYGLYRDCYRKTKYFRPNLFMWSQGFSCRRYLFDAVGGFSESYPGCGGEDWDFVSKLEQLHKNRVVDTSIIVTHIVPCGFKNVLWHIYNRGRGTAYYDLIYRKKSPISKLFNFFIKLFVFFCFILWDKNVAVTLSLLVIIRMVTDGWIIGSSSRSKKMLIIIMHMCNTIIRLFGYYITILKQIKGGKNESI